MRRCASVDCDLNEDHSLVLKAKEYHGVSFESKSRIALSNLNNISAVFTRLRTTAATKKRRSSIPTVTMITGSTDCKNPPSQLILQADVMVAFLTMRKSKKKFKSRHLMLFSDRIYLCKDTSDQVEDQSLITDVWLRLPCINDVIEESTALDDTLWIGWPIINYEIRYQTSPLCTLWYNVIEKTIKNARKHFKDAPEAMKVHLTWEASNKDKEMSVNCKNIFVQSYEDSSMLLQKALIAFKLHNSLVTSEVDFRLIYNGGAFNLVGHELPYWIAMWSVQRSNSAACSGQLLNREVSADAHPYNGTLIEAKLDEAPIQVKFLLRQKKDGIHSSNAKPAEDLLDSNTQNASKTRLRSKKGLTQFLNRGGKSKSDDLDCQNLSATPSAIGNGQLFGRSLEEIYPDGEIGPSVMGLLGYAYALIPNLEGPFRVSGNIIQIKRFQLALDEIPPTAYINMKALFEIESSKWPSPATILGLLKKFLSNIPDQLLQQSQLASWLDAWHQSNTDGRIRSFRQVLKYLPAPNLRLSELVFCLCDWVLQHSQITKLSVQGLSTSLGPSLLAPLDSFDVDAQCQLNEMVAFLIDNFDNLWPGSNARQCLDASKSAMCADNMFDDNSEQLDHLDMEHNMVAETNSIGNMAVSFSDSSHISSDVFIREENAVEAPPPPLPPRRRAQHLPPLPPKIVTRTRHLRDSRRPSLQRLSSGPSEVLHSPTDNSCANSTGQLLALRTRSASAESFNPLESPPTYEKALQRQVQLRLENFNVSSSVNDEVNDEQKIGHESSFERRVQTRLKHHPPVHVTIGNARAARLQLQSSQHNAEANSAADVDSSCSDNAPVVSLPQRSVRTKRLPKEYDVFIGKESYV